MLITHWEPRHSASFIFCKKILTFCQDELPLFQQLNRDMRRCWKSTPPSTHTHISTQKDWMSLIIYYKVAWFSTVWTSEKNHRGRVVSLSWLQQMFLLSEEKKKKKLHSSSWFILRLLLLIKSSTCLFYHVWTGRPPADSGASLRNIHVSI